MVLLSYGGAALHAHNAPRHMKISEQLNELIERMKASDARLQALTEEYTTSAQRGLDDLKKAIEEQ